MSKRWLWCVRSMIVGLLCLICWGLSSRSNPSASVTMLTDAPREDGSQSAKDVPDISSPAGYGTVIGQVVFDGNPPTLSPVDKSKDATCCPNEIPDESLVIDTKTLGIRNVFVYLRNAPSIHPDLQKGFPAEIPVSTASCRYDPHVVFARTDQTIRVRVKSSDKCDHSVHIHPIHNSHGRGLTFPEQEEETFRFKRNESRPMPVRCDVHPWMQAYWLILDHPYAAVTDEGGKFRIEKLPAGDHQFEVWQESAEQVVKELKVTIKPNQTTELGVMKFGIENFKKIADKVESTVRQ